MSQRQSVVHVCTLLHQFPFTLIFAVYVKTEKLVCANSQIYFFSVLALKAFKIDNCNQETTGDEVELFSISHIDHTLEQLLPSLFKAFCDNNIGCAPLVLSCCLLAFLWLLEESGKSDRVLFVFVCQVNYLFEPLCPKTELN